MQCYKLSVKRDELGVPGHLEGAYRIGHRVKTASPLPCMVKIFEQCISSLDTVDQITEFNLMLTPSPHYEERLRCAFFRS